MLAPALLCAQASASNSLRAEARASDARAFETYRVAARRASRHEASLDKRTAVLNAHLPPGALPLGTPLRGTGKATATVADINIIGAYHLPIWGYVYRLSDGSLEISPRRTPPVPLQMFETQVPLDAVVFPIGDAMGRPLAGSAQLLPSRPHAAEEKLDTTPR